MVGSPGGHQALSHPLPQTRHEAHARVYTHTDTHLHPQTHTSSHTWMHDDPGVCGKKQSSLGGHVWTVLFFCFFSLPGVIFKNGWRSVLFNFVFNYFLFCCFFLYSWADVFWIATCDGCDMYLVLCACIIYTYNTKQTCIHTQFIYYFSLCIKSIYRYMYINYNGSEIIYGELISGRAVAIFAAA